MVYDDDLTVQMTLVCSNGVHDLRLQVKMEQIPRVQTVLRLYYSSLVPEPTIRRLYI